MNVKDSLVDLERHRLRLEENLVKLRQSLRHWQTWEAEYEGLKEEILAAGGNASSTDLVAIGRDFGGTLINEKEIKTLLGDGKTIKRTGPQVADLVRRRLDYVQRNIETVETQIATAEEKLDSLLVIRQPEVRNDEGLPLTEIREELDEDGNVISSTIARPGDAATQVVEALRKAGVTDLPLVSTCKAELGKVTEGSEKLPTSSVESAGLGKTLNHTAGASGNDESEVFRSLQTRDPGMSARADYSETTIEAPKTTDMSDSSGSLDATSAPSTKNTSSTSSQGPTLNKSDRVTDNNIHETSQTMEDTTAENSPPVMPIDESPEDAALRRQMIQYGLHEVGAVVAELELDDETESQCSYSDDDLDGDEQYTSSNDEEEDAFGRTTRRVVDDDYRRQMLELEKKLNIRRLEKSQPELQNKLAESNKMAVEQPSDKPITSVLVDKSQKSTVKKGVRFAEELDISPVPVPPSRSIRPSEAKSAMQDLVVERAAAAPQTGLSGLTHSTPKKASRFKQAREAAQQHNRTPATGAQEAHIEHEPLSGSLQERKPLKPAASLPLTAAVSSNRIDLTASIKAPSEEARRQDPDGPPGRTHLSNIIERKVPSNAVDAPDPDNMDSYLLRQEVAVEYHRMRNRMIQREGGFLPRDGQEERVPLTEEEGGSGKKVSRFKAARLRGHA